MRIRTCIIALAAAAVALALPSIAAAKGPSKASIMGPGLNAPVTIEGEEGLADALGLLVSQTGFFPQTFGQSPDPLLREQPAARKLGARYTVTYTVPGPTTSVVRQDLYPYAAGGAISYMEAGQQIWDQKTHGGWYRAGGLSSELREMLVNAGLPRTGPAVVRNRNASHLKEMRVALGTGAGIVLAAGALIFLRRRH